MLTSVLVSVNKKKEQAFKEGYFKFLIDFNKNDFESWKKRKRGVLLQDLIEEVTKDMEAIAREENKDPPTNE